MPADKPNDVSSRARPFILLVNGLPAAWFRLPRNESPAMRRTVSSRRKVVGVDSGRKYHSSFANTADSQRTIDSALIAGSRRLDRLEDGHRRLSPQSGDHDT